MSNEHAPILSEDTQPMSSPTQASEKAFAESMCEDADAQNTQEVAHNESAEDAQKEWNMSHRTMDISAIKEPRVERSLRAGETPNSFMEFRCKTASDTGTEPRRTPGLLRTRGPCISKERRAKDEEEVYAQDKSDDSQEEMLDDSGPEGIIDLETAKRRLNALGKAMGREVEVHTSCRGFGSKLDKVDDQINLNRAKLDRIH